uniref:Uncharacterized protein n=1 Tax=Weissella thailandensis fsh4-2 TaxID=1056112 RepID=G0UG54_9LACO|nr:putative uncharacterized protein [Weissella thailandensis fsh4-2]
MIDWKYGAYTTIWWIILLATYTTAKEVTNNFGWSFLTLCLAVILVIVSSYFYEHEHPQFREKNRTSTVDHLRGIWVLFILVVYLAVALQVTHSDIFFLTCATLAQSVPAFFTKYTNSKPDKN